MLVFGFAFLKRWLASPVMVELTVTTIPFEDLCQLPVYFEMSYCPQTEHSRCLQVLLCMIWLKLISFFQCFHGYKQMDKHETSSNLAGTPLSQ